MQAFFTSTGLVAVAEIGDKTQLLSFMLAARLRRPWPIIAGILVATLLNHAAAAWFGTLVSSFASRTAVAWAAGALFIGFGLWALVPDKLDETPLTGSDNVFVSTLIAFFLVEMGDKTQLATMALAARFDSIIEVVLGTTLGMMLANAPAVWIGEKLSVRLPFNTVRMVAAGLFIATGLLTWWGARMGAPA